jgi:hypothetical protein
MSLIWSDVASAGSSIVRATMTPAGAIRLSDGSSLDFGGQTAAEMRVSAKGDQIVVAAQVGDRRDTLQLVDNRGHRYDSGVTAYGVNCLDVRPHVLGWQCTLVLGAGPSRAAGAYWGRFILSDALGLLSTTIDQWPIEIGATSQGFLGISTYGWPIWTDASRQLTVGGVPAALWSQSDGWVIFQSRESADRICAYEQATGRVFVVWTGHTEHAPRIAATPDGQVLAAINGYDVFIPREQFVPWSPIPVVDEPPAQLPPPMTPWPCRVAVFFHGNSNPSHPLPASIRSSDGTRDLPLVNVDDAIVFATIPGTAEGTEAGLQGAIARAKATGLPLGAYRDAPDYPPELVPVVDGVEIFPIVRAYPERQPDGMEPLADAKQRIVSTILALKRAGHARVGMATAYYRQIEGDGSKPIYNWPLQYVINLADAVADIARQTSIRDLYVFEWSRANGNDGIVSRPELMTLFTRLLEAAQPVSDSPAPPAPTSSPVPHEDEPMRTNPTDKLTYTEVDGELAARAAGRGYTDGCFDAYRLLAEGTPLDAVRADRSAPTQEPIPAVPYLQWAAVARGLLAAREKKNKGTGYTDGVLDTFRRFGGERWPLEYIMSDIDDEELPARPWGLF